MSFLKSRLIPRQLSGILVHNASPLGLRVDDRILAAHDEGFAMLEEVAHRREERFRPFCFNDVPCVIYERVITVGDALDVAAPHFRWNYAVSRSEQYKRRRLYVSESAFQFGIASAAA